MKCLKCGHVNAFGHKFCSECGQSLDAAHEASVREPRAYTPLHLAERILQSRSAIEGERKTVTVMFCDIVNSTTVAVGIGPNAMHRLLDNFFEAALGEVHRYEGTINQFLGDGFMALFGAPLAHEDHARRALMAALSIRDAVSKTVSDGAIAAPLALRIGMNSGSVVVGKIGDNLRMDYTAVGDTTNVAARLQHEAKPGEILISDDVYRVVEPFFVFKKLGLRQLKGRPEPVLIYLATGARAVRSHRPDAPRPTLVVGRQIERDAIEESLDRLQSGLGGVLNIVGEAGLGKSRLLIDGRVSAERRRLRWAQGSCVSFGQTFPYLPFAQALRGCFLIDDADSNADALHKLRGGMQHLFAEMAEEQLLPYLSALLGLPILSHHADRLRALDSLSMRHQIFRASLMLFSRYAMEWPLALVFDDWHWADISSGEMLSHLMPLSDRVPLLFIIANRPGRSSNAASFTQAVRSQEPSLKRLRTLVLGPLPQEQCSQLLVHLLDGANLPSHVRSMLLRRSDGNPFYLGELLKALIGARGIELDVWTGDWLATESYASVRLPETIEGVIQARIDQLDDSFKQVLKIASVIGRRFLYRLLQPIVNDQTALDAALAKLQQLDLIHQGALVPELEYVFAQPLIQQATYDSILEERLQQTHLQVAHGIEQLFAERLEEFHTVLAYHYARAQEWGPAEDYLLMAADQADRLAADEEALMLYEAAIKASELSRVEELDPLRRAQLDRKLGDAHFRAGRHEPALSAYMNALNRLGVNVPRRRWRVGVTIVAALCGQALQRHLQWRTAADAGLLQPRAMLGAEIWQAMAFIHFLLDPLRSAYDFVRIEWLTRRHREVQPHIVCLGQLGMTLTALGFYRMATPYLLEARELAAQYGDKLTCARANHFYAVYLHHVGHWVEAVKFGERAVELCWSTGNLRAWAAFVANVALYLYALGDSRWMALVEKLAQVAGETADRQAAAWAIAAVAMACEHRGEYEQSLVAAQRACEIAASVPDQRTLSVALGQRSVAFRRLGEVEHAKECSDKAVALIVRYRLSGTWCTRTLVDAADLHLLLLETKGDKYRQSARVAVNALRRHGRRVRDEGAVEAHRVTGTYAWLCGKPGRAIASWSRGFNEARTLGATHAKARIMVERGGRTRSREELLSAVVVLAECGATGEQRRVQAVLDSSTE